MLVTPVLLWKYGISYDAVHNYVFPKMTTFPRIFLINKVVSLDSPLNSKSQNETCLSVFHQRILVFLVRYSRVHYVTIVMLRLNMFIYSN